jgi:hypothetical protein
MHTNDPITKSVSNAYIKMKAEELTAKQKKIDLNKNNKIDGEDLAKLRKEDNEVEEGWDDMMKAVKAKSGPQPSGGSGVKKGTRYGGSNQKDEPEVKEKPTAKTKKKPFSEMLQTYKSAGLKSLFEAIEEKAIAEESTNDEFKAELDDTQSKSTGKKKAEVSKPKVDAVQQEEVEAIAEDDTGYQDRYAVKNGKAVKHNPERGEKDEPHHVWADGPDHAVRKHAKMIKPGMKKEDMDINDINGVRMSTIGEAEMTDAEKAKREDIVKGMKKGMAGFKERYGDRAKSVMYATATKQAMKD